MKNKHLTFNERLEIEQGLKNNLSFKELGRRLSKDCTTISKEIKNHIVYKNSGAYGKPFFDCIYRNKCEFKDKGIKCNFSNCSHYVQEICSKLSKPPYVCNGCNNRNKCTLTKRLYDAIYSQNEYTSILSESRTGITYSKGEIERLNTILKPLIVDKGQSVHHAYINNVDSIICSEKQIYNLIDKGVLEIKNIDLPRKVKYRLKPKRKKYHKIDKDCLKGRTYQDYQEFIKDNPDINLVEMDSVEGKKGGKVLLTIHFVNCSFMFAFIREHNDSQSVIDTFNKIENIIGLDKFKVLFPVILTDNGTEFSNPTKIEISSESNEQRTKIFYCEPGRSDQKGSCEVNHEMIRRVLPKGTSFDDLSQNDINLVMSHINSYKRKKLNNCSPIQLFNVMYGNNIANKLGIIEINPNDINLSTNLTKKKD